MKDLSGSVETVLADLYGKQKQLAEASLQVSFKSLFEAVVQLQNTSPEQCPACHTPLQQVTKNPYSHASEELLKLEFLSALQGEIAQLEQSISQQMYRVCKLSVPVASFFLMKMFSKDSGKTMASLCGVICINQQAMVLLPHLLEKQVLQLEEEDKKSRSSY